MLFSVKFILSYKHIYLRNQYIAYAFPAIFNHLKERSPVSASLRRAVNCGISLGYRFDDKKPDSPALKIQFAHFPFRPPSEPSDHDEKRSGVLD